MSEPLADWPRPYYQGPGGSPFLFYVVYGAFDAVPPLDAGRYRSNGVYPGLTLARYTGGADADLLDGFRAGYPWDEFVARHPALADRVQRAGDCLILQGELDDQPDLNYLRDSVGLLAFLFDHGGLAVFDPEMLRWWSYDEWRQESFDSDQPVPGRHVAMMVSDNGDGSTWIHTRGMRKFGRPDVSVQPVLPRHQGAVVDLCNRLVLLQALGAIVPEGQEFDGAALPPGLVGRHRAGHDEQNFNNAYIELGPSPPT